MARKTVRRSVRGPKPLPPVRDVTFEFSIGLLGKIPSKEAPKILKRLFEQKLGRFGRVIIEELHIEGIYYSKEDNTTQVIGIARIRFE